jgi:hypothetical protein
MPLEKSVLADAVANRTTRLSKTVYDGSAQRANIENALDMAVKRHQAEGGLTQKDKNRVYNEIRRSLDPDYTPSTVLDESKYPPAYTTERGVKIDNPNYSKVIDKPSRKDARKQARMIAATELSAA